MGQNESKQAFYPYHHRNASYSGAQQPRTGQYPGHGPYQGQRRDRMAQPSKSYSNITAAGNSRQHCGDHLGNSYVQGQFAQVRDVKQTIINSDGEVKGVVKYHERVLTSHDGLHREHQKEQRELHRKQEILRRQQWEEQQREINFRRQQAQKNEQQRREQQRMQQRQENLRRQQWEERQREARFRKQVAMQSHQMQQQIQQDRYRQQQLGQKEQRLEQVIRQQLTYGGR